MQPHEECLFTSALVNSGTLNRRICMKVSKNCEYTNIHISSFLFLEREERAVFSSLHTTLLPHLKKKKALSYKDVYYSHELPPSSLTASKQLTRVKSQESPNKKCRLTSLKMLHRVTMCFALLTEPTIRSVAKNYKT